jgi:hypothetical protein
VEKRRRAVLVLIYCCTISSLARMKGCIPMGLTSWVISIYKRVWEEDISLFA